MTTTARGIKFPVGRNGINREADVRVIQQLLNRNLENNPKFRTSGVQKLVVDGKCGPKTVAAIAAYQEKVLRWRGQAVDATVHPNRKTWKSLNGNVASSSEVKRAVDIRPERIAGYRAFRQGDYRSVRLGVGDETIARAGCALCTLTMAATVIGSPTTHWPDDLEPRDLTPPIVNRILKSAGAFSGSGLKMGDAARALGMEYFEYGLKSPVKPSDVGLITSNLLAGNPVAAHVDYKASAWGDHWILIIRRANPTVFEAIDPATGLLVSLTSAPQTLLRGRAVERFENIPNGVLLGWGQGGGPNQQRYVVTRFGLLAPLGGGYSAAH